MHISNNMDFKETFKTEKVNQDWCLDNISGTFLFAIITYAVMKRLF